MAIKKSAKKALKRSLKNKEMNLFFKLMMKKSIKSYLKALNSKEEKTDVLSLLSKAYSAIDKAVKRGVIKKQTAARKKSRLARKLV
jgi:small subunit ribosomal protein S20